MASNVFPHIQLPYVGTLVTLAAASPTRYNLWALVNANRPNTPMAGREVTVQISSSQGAKVYFGDGALTENDYGTVLSASDGLSKHWGSDQGNVIWGSIFVMTDTVNATISVEILGC